MTIRILTVDSKEKTVGAVCADIVITFLIRLITTTETNQFGGETYRVGLAGHYETR